MPMDLVEQVCANLEIDSSKAEKGVGAILMALRVSLDHDTFDAVKHALPNCESLMGRALMSGARTGEMAALVGAAGLWEAPAAAAPVRLPPPDARRRVRRPRPAPAPALCPRPALATAAPHSARSVTASAAPPGTPRAPGALAPAARRPSRAPDRAAWPAPGPGPGPRPGEGSARSEA